VRNLSEIANGVWVVSGVFSIPLEAYRSRSNEASGQASPRGLELREYIGSDENRLVEFAVQSLFSGHSQYNPIVFFGSTGTGKTLLALGLADRWRHEHPRHRVIATSGIDFARSFANAVDTDGLSAFRAKSRSVDLLVVDDVHLLHAKRAAQEELARLLDALVAREVPILATAARSPAMDDRFVPALCSRLSAGLLVPLDAPGQPARRMLVHRFAELYDVELTDAAIDLLAAGSTERENDRLTVPELCHAVLQLGHLARVGKRTVDIENVRLFLDDQAEERKPDLRSITNKVAKYFSLSTRQLRGPSRRRHVVRARGVAMYLAWNLTNNSLENVGRYFGNRDHTTVLHACRRVQSLQQTDPVITKAVDELSGQLSRT
jgi:chromosomal replication initiator protein